MHLNLIVTVGRCAEKMSVEQAPFVKQLAANGTYQADGSSSSASTQKIRSLANLCLHIACDRPAYSRQGGCELGDVSKWEKKIRGIGVVEAMERLVLL